MSTDLWPSHILNTRRAGMAWLLLVVSLLGLSWENLYRPVFLVLSLIGLYQFFSYGKEFWARADSRLLTTLFSSLWVPMVASLPDAMDLHSGLRTSSRYLIYYFAGLAFLRLVWSKRATNQLFLGCVAVIVFWTLDGIYQFIMGENILGYPMFQGDRLTGMFKGTPDLCFVLAVLSPLYFEAIRRLSVHFSQAWLLLIPLVLVIMLGGGRAPWLLFGVGAILYLWLVIRLRERGFPWLTWVGRVAFILLLAVMLINREGWLDERVSQILELASGDYQKVNAATSLRIPLWQASWHMFTGHWFNGIGVRNFSTLFLERQPEALAIYGHPHPHLFVGEIATDTGVLGLLGYSYFMFLLWRNIAPKAPALSTPWAISVFLASFPLSSTLSFYSLFSSTLLWVLLLGWLVTKREETL